MQQATCSTASARGFERANRWFLRWVGGALMTLGLAVLCQVMLSGSSLAQTAPPSVPDISPGSLKAVKIQDPPNLSDFVADRQAAVQLGKAFFWDMQMGSDGITACATCHSQAGADVRSKNTLNPGMAGGDTTFQLGGPNYQLTPGDFPFHRFSVPSNNQSAVAKDTNDVVGAAGVFARDFKAPAIATQKQGEDVCQPIAGDAPFTVGGINTRRVTGRNAPSVINAAFNFRNFWDGRANNNFNGVNPFGDRDPDAVIFKNIVGSNTPQPVRVSIPFSSLASQAVGPPGSPFEMSCDGRVFPNMGRKMLAAVPLAQQVVDPNDSVLGTLAKNGPSTPEAKGLNTTYEQLIMKAFRPEYWQSGALVNLDNTTPVTGSMLSSDFFRLVGGKVIEPLKAKDEPKVIIPNNRYKQMESNFSLFWGLAIQLYEDTLIANDSPVDRYFDGTGALTPEQLDGLSIFQGQGRCINCHGGAETTNASIRKVTNERLERMITGNGSVGVYDDGFYNIGVRPTTDDVGIGGKDPFGNPLSEVGLCQQQLAAGKTCDPSVLNIVPRPLEGINGGSLTPSERTVVDGAFKVPGLRNVELTGPYFHNGGQATLRQVVDFYDRGGDFANQNLANLDTDISRIGLDDTQKKHLVAFLVALTDDRVRYEKGPFDHPSLCIPNGHPGNTTAVTISSDPQQRGQAADDMTTRCLSAVGAGGRAQPLTPFLGLDPQAP